MMKRGVAVCLGLTLCHPLHARQPAASGAAASLVVRVTSGALGGEQLAAVMVPSGYAESRARYPVVYLLHGGGQDHTAFAARAWFGEQRARNLIIVTPKAGDSWYVNSAADAQARYEDFVIKDLIPYIDANYRTVASREGRAIAGVSMGAWGAMLLGLKHHQLFASIGALSAPFGISRQDPDMDMKSRTQQRFGAPGTAERRARDPGVLAGEIAAESLPHLFLACGAQDIFVRDNRGFTQRLNERKLPYEYREISPAGHSWEVWDAQLVNYLGIVAERWRSLPR